MTSSAHTAEIYRSDEELAASVGAFLRSGLEQGATGVVLATPEHRRLIREAVGTSLLEADAEELLASILVDGMPSAPRFEASIATLLEQHGRPLFVYGELVSMLVERGDIQAAIQLEDLWNGLVRRRPVTLLCGYRLDVFDLAVQQGPLPRICGVHDHLTPASDGDRFAAAVDRGLTTVFGAVGAEDVYYVVGGRKKRRAPRAQEALRWVAKAMPQRAEEVLAVARKRYG